MVDGGAAIPVNKAIAKSSNSDRYIVARHCNGGIGDHLSCLIGAWWLAKRTNRILVIDWRGSRFNPDSTMNRNCFLDFFAVPKTLAGVMIIADDRVSEIKYPTPMWPEKWNEVALRSSLHLKHTTEEVFAINRLVTSDLDRGEPTIAINQWVEPPPPRQAVQQLIRDLRPAEFTNEAVNDFWRQNIRSELAIAIHIRHGNGENVGDRAAYWLGPIALARQLILNARNDVHQDTTSRFNDNMPISLIGSPGQIAAERRFCQVVADEFKALAKKLGRKNAIPLLFCDSPQAIASMRKALPDLITCPKYFPHAGDGPLHQANGGTVSDKITRDMFIELELMNRCYGLLYMDSGFSIMARTLLDEAKIVRLRPSLTNRVIAKIIARL
jgi:hypothetical protein